MGLLDFFFGSKDGSDDSHIHDDPSAGRTYASDPHKGSTATKEHVDTYTWRDGKRERGNEQRHLTDEGSLRWGSKSKEWREKQKGGK